MPPSVPWASHIFSRFVASVCAILLVTADQSRAGIRSSGSEFQSFYQVVSSNDPLFPMDRGQEWFLDFGRMDSAGMTHGSVSVSLRQNPNLRIRIFSWQYYPKTAILVIGNPTEPGSNQAVVRAYWRMLTTQAGIRLERGQHHVTLCRADPSD